MPIQCTFPKGYTAQLRHLATHCIVEKDGAILVVKRHISIPEGGKWGLPGGYVQRDETASESAVRELLEETGWEGEVVQLFRISTSPRRRNDELQNVGMDFIVKPVRLTGEKDWESTEIAWLPLNHLPDNETFAFDHYQLIAEYVAWKQKNFPLPIVDE